ncbi:uncharacterized protein LOC116926569 [Daphnia magna]|uniref:uncharacterized protein LOC116926569 n=1 Tax=Daphnia magna TaxID=35525 RepID=UPI001E1BB50F|nr:uncharacterized protein LOC116926569 [Daphnia magna]
MSVIRKLCVQFESLKNPVRSKCVKLPAPSTRSDLAILKETLLRQMLDDMSILDLQFNKSKLTRVEDLIICEYDEDFGQPIEVHLDVVLFDKDIVMVRLRKPVVEFSECEEPGQKLDNVSNNGDISEGAESTDFLNSSLEEDRMYTSTPYSVPLELTGASSSSKINTKRVKKFCQRKEISEAEDNSTYVDIGQLDGSINSLNDVTASNSRVPCTTLITSMKNPRPSGSKTTVNRNHLQADSDGEIARDQATEPEILKQLKSRVPLTLPQKGSESWEINPQLALAIKNNLLLLHQNQFIAVCAMHFKRTQPLGNKGLFRSYAYMIVTKYDVLRDHGPISYVTVKEKVIRAINNSLDSQQHGARRKLARNQKKHAKKQQAAAVTTNDVLDASNSIQPSGDDIDDEHPNNDLLDEEEEKKIEEFKARKEIFNSKKKLSTKAMLEKILSYNNFEIVYEDFARMEPMCDLV